MQHNLKTYVDVHKHDNNCRGETTNMQLVVIMKSPETTWGDKPDTGLYTVQPISLTMQRPPPAAPPPAPHTEAVIQDWCIMTAAETNGSKGEKDDS